jgi:hypothetical protein
MELAMRFLQQEENRAVLRFLTADGLPALLFNHDPELLADLLARLLERFPRTPGNEDLRSSALARVVDLHLFRAVPRALRLIDDALEHIQDDPNTALQLVLLRRGILIWQTDAVARSAAEIRRAALELMQRACQKVSPLLRALEDRHRSTHDEGERGTIRDQWEQLHRILGSIVLETTHATDGDSLRSTLGEAASQTYKTVRSKFWEEAHDLLDVLATAPLDAHDVDRLLSTLSSYSDSDPLRVLTLLRAVLGRARETGFLDDRFGGPRLLELCQRLIVGHPELFVTDGPQASILDLLDALVEAEWPEAEVLAARLQNVWR